MARSRLGENQFRDEDVLSHQEHSDTNHYFNDLADVEAISGNRGKYVKVADDSDTLTYGDPSVSGSGGSSPSSPENTVTSGIVIIEDLDFNGKKVKKGYMVFENGLLTSYSGTVWTDYSDFTITFT